MPGVGAYLWLRDRNGVDDKKKWELLYDPKNWSYDLLLVISIPGSCVQAFKQYEVAGHVSDALSESGFFSFSYLRWIYTRIWYNRRHKVKKEADFCK